MRGYFYEDEYEAEDDEVGAYWDEDDMCIDCQRLGSMMDECSVCGASMCGACYEMGCGVCKGPHR